jgi:hypothetical protein
LPGVIRLSAAQSVTSDETPLPELAPLPAVNSEGFEDLCTQKLEICSIIMDFSVKTRQIQPKAVKRAILTEFNNLFDRELEAGKLTEPLRLLLFQMLHKNIFEQDPTHLISHLESDYTVAVLDPSWPHLALCFQLLSKFVRVFPTSPAISLDIAIAALQLTQLPDPNIRMQFTVFLRAFFDTRPADRSCFLSALSGRLLELLQGKLLPFSGGPLVTVFGHIATRMPSVVQPVYLRAILPLLGFRYLTLFVKNLKQVFCSVVPPNPDLVLPTMRAIEKYWAFSDGLKQALLLDILFALCAKLPPPILETFSVRLFRFLNSLLVSPTVRVVEQILDLWANCAVGDWVATNSKAAMTETFDNVCALKEKHWLLSVTEKAGLALIGMAKVDKSTFQKLRAQQKQLKAQRFQRKYIGNECQKQWNRIAEAAGANHPDLNVNAKKHDIYDLFHNERPEVLAPSRFGPCEKPPANS